MTGTQPRVVPCGAVGTGNALKSGVCHPGGVEIHNPPRPRSEIRNPLQSLIIATGSSAKAGDRVVEAIAKHRHLKRETDPPRV